MTDTAPADWSPADNPYAIAVSEAHWWLLAAKLAIARIRDGDDPRTAFSSRQIDARQLVVALCQLLVAEQLENWFSDITRQGIRRGTFTSSSSSSA